jgi:hypothetical protein
LFNAAGAIGMLLGQKSAGLDLHLAAAHGQENVFQNLVGSGDRNRGGRFCPKMLSYGWKERRKE